MLYKLVRLLAEKDEMWDNVHSNKVAVQGYGWTIIHSDGSWVIYDGVGLSLDNGNSMDSLEDVILY